MRIEDLPECYRDQARELYGKATGNKTTVCAANVESAACNDPMGPKANARFDSPVSIRIHSKRKRLADSDGVSAKAAIDGLVHCGILQDDSPKFVKEVSYSQEQSEGEETIITIEEI